MSLAFCNLKWADKVVRSGISPAERSLHQTPLCTSAETPTSCASACQCLGQEAKVAAHERTAETRKTGKNRIRTLAPTWQNTYYLEDTGLFRVSLKADVIHEGVHVEDRAAFANSITYGGEAGAHFFYDGSLNITGPQSERNPMGVENEFRRSVGMPQKDIEDTLAHPPYSNNPNIDKLLFSAFGDAQ